MKEKHSAVILVFNSQQKLALQLRAAHDDKYPLHWDFSAAGGIEVGEDPLLAAERELKEELGIVSPLTFKKMVFYKDELCTDELFIYTTYYEEDFTPDSHEVEKVEFFSTTQIETMVANREKFHPEFPFVWTNYPELFS